LSARMLPILSRISDIPNGFRLKCQFGSIFGSQQESVKLAGFRTLLSGAASGKL
jgi:hypothetical protein